MRRHAWPHAIAAALCAWCIASFAAPAGADPGRVQVEIRADGTTRRWAVLPNTTVGELLSAAGIALGEHDRAKPGRFAPVFDRLSVTVFRVKVRDAAEVVRVPYAVEVEQNRDLRQGLVRVEPGTWQDGVLSERVRYYERDDGVVERVVLESAPETPMRPKVITVGTKGASPSRESRLPGRLVDMHATAYAPDPRDCGDGCLTTSIGLPAGRGIVAVDPDVIPYGTRMFVEGYGWAVAGDTGGAIQGMRIDLCFDSRDAALRYGSRSVKVRLYE